MKLATEGRTAIKLRHQISFNPPFHSEISQPNAGNMRGIEMALSAHVAGYDACSVTQVGFPRASCCEQDQKWHGAAVMLAFTQFPFFCYQCPTRFSLYVSISVLNLFTTESVNTQSGTETYLVMFHLLDISKFERALFEHFGNYRCRSQSTLEMQRTNGHALFLGSAECCAILFLQQEAAVWSCRTLRNCATCSMDTSKYCGSQCWEPAIGLCCSN